MARALPAASWIGVAAAIAVPLLAQEPAPDRQPTPFRTGAHYVRVDAYPVRDGKPIAGLTAADFDLLEDGKRQTIDAVEFIEHPAWTPLADRRDPNSQRDGFELARNAGYRVFVLYLDAYHVDMSGSHRVRVPLRELLNRMMGPKDLFGLLTPAQTVKDLMLGQLSQMIEDQLENSPMWGIAGRREPQPGEDEIEFTFPREWERLVALRRLDKVYSDLESLVDLLGSLRDERKSIIFFSDALASPRSPFSNMASDPSNPRGTPPTVGVGPTGTLTLGSRNAGDPDRLRMNAERARLLSIDFDLRFRELLQRSRQANVAFYCVRPGGLTLESSISNAGIANLRTLADETDGLSIHDTNDLRAGMRRIADDLSSHYVLGYYTSNTRWDGRTRKLTVRLKSTGQTIRARREYRAPTEEEMASIRRASERAAAPAPVSPTAAALSTLSRVHPSRRMNAYGIAAGNDVLVVAEIGAAETEAGRWRQGASVEVTLTAAGGEVLTAQGRIEPASRGTLVRVPVGEQAGPWQAHVRVRGDELSDADTVAIERRVESLLGAPLAYRAGSAAASPFRPLASFNFRRTERVRVEWPLVRATDTRSARLLDRNGNALAVPVTLSTRDADGRSILVGDVNLAPLSSGDYVIEATATSGGVTDRQLLAIRVSMAR